MDRSRQLRALVTGGGGFLGRAIVERLLARGDSVRSLARGYYPELSSMGVETIQADIADRSAVIAACDGCEVVFHVAANAGIWGRYADYHRPNVIGTENVIAGCRAHGVSGLVYTSSPSVVFAGRDMEGADESAPYPPSYHAAYPKTKAIAEQAVLAADGGGLHTVALRPHLIWGPRDNQLVPRIIKRADKLRRIGNVDKKVDCIYIDNAADAHLLACDRLGPGAAVCGKAYFVSQGEPRGLWELVNGILAAAGKPPVTRSVPYGAAMTAAIIFETLHAVLRIRREPPMTRFLVRELSTAHWFDISAARRDLGYEPTVSIDEGLKQLGKWLRSSRGGDAPPRDSE